jgi:hypothetical protein
VEAARAWGVPWSVLTGRPVAPGEPEWTQRDTDLAVGLVELERAACDGCGVPRAESMDPQREFEWVAEPIRCHACATRERAAKAKADDRHWDGSGIRWSVRSRGG